jgi:hypothetical protein
MPTDTAATQTARDYYNSADADTFYFQVWGGEDIHVGLYAREGEPIQPMRAGAPSTIMADRLGVTSGPMAQWSSTSARGTGAVRGGWSSGAVAGWCA